MNCLVGRKECRGDRIQCIKQDWKEMHSLIFLFPAIATVLAVASWKNIRGIKKAEGLFLKKSHKKQKKAVSIV